MYKRQPYTISLFFQYSIFLTILFICLSLIVLYLFILIDLLSNYLVLLILASSLFRCLFISSHMFSKWWCKLSLFIFWNFVFFLSFPLVCLVSNSKINPISQHSSALSLPMVHYFICACGSEELGV